MAFSIKKEYRKIFLALDGVLMVLFGVLVFITLAGYYVYSDRAFRWGGFLVSAGIILLTLFFIISGVALVRRHKYGGIIAAVLFLLGLAATFTSYILWRDIAVLGAFFFYVFLSVLLVLGQKELK